ncbi:hypothetical protein CF15_01670 [Pyrodictium occultum]|uniref:Cas6 N-terminal domain-containing protein n=1 Tax=Pyrodictium occultum TaxID=2309 RepID=A0A0V8RUA1_PYROC|nr:hypothetical protein CF15_01670 [Pyrodictium occultum]
MVLPPASSKVVKSLVLQRGGWLAGLASPRQGYKPLFISMLYRGGRHLYARAGLSQPQENVPFYAF